VDARDELRRVEGLGQIVVGPHLEPDDPVDLFAFRGQHDDRDGFAGAANPSAHRESVFAGQHEIQHDQMRRVALELFVEVPCVRERWRPGILVRVVARQEVAQTHVVVDD
jgi:hypothetical protein